MTVVDASAVVEMLLRTAVGERCRERLLAVDEALDAPLVTSDGRFARAHGHHAKVQVVE